MTPIASSYICNPSDKKQSNELAATQDHKETWSQDPWYVVMIEPP